MLRWIVLFLTVFGARFSYAQIYDCFPFFNELEILDIRLHELYDHVDKFVLVESVETFRGTPKPLLYQENRRRYEKFSDKIIHVVVERFKTDDPWERERFQRNQIMRGLQGCFPDDIIIVSDVDEILSAGAVQEIVKAIYHEKKTAVVCGQKMYRFYLNTEDVSSPWGAVCATTFDYLTQVWPERFRIQGKIDLENRYPLIPNCGWHFTCMGGLEAYSNKLESFSHSECDVPENKTQQAVQDYIDKHCRLVPIDDTFPAYVRENQEYFQDNGYKFFM